MSVFNVASSAAVIGFPISGLLYAADEAKQLIEHPAEHPILQVNFWSTVRYQAILTFRFNHV